MFGFLNFVKTVLMMLSKYFYPLLHHEGSSFKMLFVCFFFSLVDFVGDFRYFCGGFLV